MGETTRQKRIQKQIQQDMAEIFQAEARETFKGMIISVTQVKVTSDLMDARIYISAFPMENKQEFMDFIINETPKVRNLLGQRIRHQMRRVPNIEFVYDDSIDYVDKIDKALKGDGIDPIKDSRK